MIHYILQVLFFQLLFLLVYDLFLKKETFFNYNRLYLLVTPILAFAIPWLRLEFLVNAVPESARLVIPQALNNDPDIYVQNLPLVVINAEGGWTPNWWLLTYLTGTVFSLGLFIYKYLHLKKLSEAGNHTYENEFRIINVPDSRIAYTFFNSVYLGEELSAKEKKQILSHELIHVKQKHTYDLIFFEVMKILFWFNPLVYIYQSRIAGVHEFIADNEVVKTVEKKTYFEQLLNTAFNTKDITFTNQFFTQSLIKKRIVMLQKNRSKRISKFKFLMLIPVMLVMLTYVACSEDIGSNENEPNLDQYNYSLKKGEDLNDDSAKSQTHAKYENFLFENPEYVSWATINYESDMIDYSVHHESERVPEGYRKMEVSSPEGKSYTMYMNLSAPDAKSGNKAGELSSRQIDNSEYDGKQEVPFAVIDQAPAFEGCDKWVDDPRKNCTSSKIADFVNANFNTDLGKALGLTGVNRVIVQFRIDETGNVQDIKSRAARPELEEEAKRVIASLPQFIPGEQNGRPVSVMYSLPIAFKVD